MANTKIVLVGMKGCGKSTVGKLLAKKLNIPFIELDDELEKIHFKTKKEKFTCREIYRKYGQEYFRTLETAALNKLSQDLNVNNFVLACGGGTPLNMANQKILKSLGKIIYLKPDNDALLERIIKSGTPAFFSNPDDPKKSFDELLKSRNPIYEKLAGGVLECENKNPEQIVNMIKSQL